MEGNINDYIEHLEERLKAIEKSEAVEVEFLRVIIQDLKMMNSDITTYWNEVS